MPAWNEAAVIGASIDRLMQLDYPPESLRVYVVNDASTDDTPDVIKAKAVQYPGQVVHLRREKGGEGKSTRSTTACGSSSPTTGCRRCSSWTPT